MSQNKPAERSFDCESCHGVIQIPYDLEPTKAPCPYCGEEILSPPLPEEASEPVVLTPVVGHEVRGAKEQVSSEVPEEVALESVDAPATTETVGQEAVRAPDGPSKVGEGFKGETFEQLEKEEKSTPARRRKTKKQPSQQSQRKVSPLVFLGAGGALVVVVIAVLLVINRGDQSAPGDESMASKKKGDQDQATIERVRYLEEGWKRSASQVLNSFLSAEAADDKCAYVIGGRTRLEEMSEFYQGRQLLELDTPTEAFNHEDLVMADKERGIFLMRFDQPAQFAMKDFFRPVAPLEVKHRVEAPDPLLTSVSNPENYQTDSVRVLAYFKEEGNALKLDWDVFAQTKYRLMREFLDNPVPGSSRIFRVRLHEDVPPHSGTDPREIRYYRCIDPAHDTDFVKVGVGAGSTLGEHLAPLNWIGLDPGNIPSRGATLELEWSDEEEPRVYIKRLICWEYLGLGGVLGNLQLSSGADTAMVVPTP